MHSVKPFHFFLRFARLSISGVFLVITTGLLTSCETSTRPTSGFYNEHAFTPEEAAAYKAKLLAMEEQWKGTPFAHDNQMGWRQCQVSNCYQEGVAISIPAEQVMQWWKFHRAVVEPDETSLLLTTCSDYRISGHCRLRRYDIASGKLEELSEQEPGRSYFSPSYSPDGQQIAVVTWRCEGSDLRTRCNKLQPGLWLIDRQGRKLREVLGSMQQSKVVDVAGRSGSIPSEGVEVDRPTFSPDGRRLAYWKSQFGVQFRSGLAGYWHLYELELSSGVERQLDNVYMGVPEGGPKYLADGRLLFSADFYNPIDEQPPVVRQMKTHIFTITLKKVSQESDMNLLIPVEGNYGQWTIHDASLDGRYVLYSGATAKEGPLPSLYLYDVREQKTTRKLWEGYGYTDPDSKNPRLLAKLLNNEGLSAWGFPLDAHLSSRMQWLVQVNGSARDPQEGGRVFLVNMRDGQVRRLEPFKFQPGNQRSDLPVSTTK